MGFLIFFFGNLGMRFLGLWELIKTNILFKVSIFLSILLPLLFLQKGVASNTSQFFQYFILPFGILSGIAVSKITSNNKFRILIPIIIILMIPTQTRLLKEFYVSEGSLRPPFTKISSYEIEALEFIKNNTDEDAIIITPPYNQYLNLKKTIPDIWDWFDTSYVSSISSRRTYFDDYEQVDIMGYDYRPRLEVKETIFKSENAEDARKALKTTDADILYFPKAVRPKVSPLDLGLKILFENSEVEVWTTE